MKKRIEYKVRNMFPNGKGFEASKHFGGYVIGILVGDDIEDKKGCTPDCPVRIAHEHPENPKKITRD